MTLIKRIILKPNQLVINCKAVESFLFDTRFSDKNFEMDYTASDVIFD